MNSAKTMGCGSVRGKQDRTNRRKPGGESRLALYVPGIKTAERSIFFGQIRKSARRNSGFFAQSSIPELAVFSLAKQKAQIDCLTSFCLVDSPRVIGGL
jgi:hypothetical protein